jgi:hypothetical protein
MATVTLPLVPSIANYRLGTLLDGVQYTVDVHWNARAGAWYMDFYTADETPIRMGIKIVLGVLLGGRVPDPAFPHGAMFAIDMTGSGTDAGIDDLGTRVIVVYVPAADL